MTIAWGKKPDSEPPLSEPLPPSVTGPSGAVYGNCDTVAGVDKHIQLQMFKLGTNRTFPKRITAIWQDIDALLERRQLLSMETWLMPSDLPL